MHRYTFFSGKGGVGKTTLAAATAVRTADAGKRTLIVSTDPASNLGDVFERPIGHRVTEIAPNLFALEIDPDSATQEYRDRLLGPLRAVLPPDVVKVLEEQFRSACTVEIASFDRFTDFLGDTEYDHVVFDTAPTGHTLRLLKLPVDWSRHIEESARGSGQTCIGPVASIQGAKAKYDRAVAALRDPGDTEFVLVCRPERTSVDELFRARGELRELGIGNFRIVVNGMIPAGAGGPFDSLSSSQREQVRRLSGMLDHPRLEVPLQGGEVKGLSALRRFAAIAFDKKPDYLHGGFTGTRPFRGFSPPGVLGKMVNGGAEGKTVVLTGKGGVGKTVAACALAARLARGGKRTLLATTDPAAHIGQVLSAEVTSEVRPVPGYPGLFAARIDQKASVEVYKAKILSRAAASGHTDEMLAVVREELSSPCTEEMAVFEEFSALVERADFDVVVLDTAPTGHTLRLLELPYDYGRQVEMMVAVRKDDAAAAGAKGKLDALLRRLKDPDSTAFFVVIYPEYTPIFEAKRAAEELKESGIEVQGVIANFILDEKDCPSSFAMSRYFMQQHYLRVAEETFRLPIFKVPML
ncbi:MAG: TRC40/GET3/ArsA family transport-energizing ATPase, partial [Candidatus Deferrimicrobiota bacterium]